MVSSKLQRAFEAFDAYNFNDPHKEVVEGKAYPKEYLYGIRMTEKLNAYSAEAKEYIQLAARCQHIGRWEIPRNTFPMDRKGYLQWRAKLALHHAHVASDILAQCGYDEETIEKVKFLLQKKELLKHHPETQLLEDVICLVFIEFYLEEFALQHEDEKVIDILKKTIKKMSSQALNEVAGIPMSPRMSNLVKQAVS